VHCAWEQANARAVNADLPFPLCKEESYFSGIKLPPANLSNLQRMNGVFDGEHNSHMKERLANSVATQVRSLLLCHHFKRFSSPQATTLSSRAAGSPPHFHTPRRAI
jgi:hypothetical protein